MENKNHTLKRVLACVMVVLMVVTAVPMSGFVGIELPKLSEMFATRAEAVTLTGPTYKYEEFEFTIETATGRVILSSVDPSIVGDEENYGIVCVPNVSSLGGIFNVSEIYIGEGAFRNCSNMTGIYLDTEENSCKYISIGNNAFEGCTSLQYVIIGDSITSIGKNAFKDCPAIERIYFGSGVKSVGENAFSACESITVYENICRNAFKGCTNLKQIDFDESVTSIGDSAFSGCTGLTSVMIPDSVTSIGSYAFSGCTGMTSVTIPDSVTSIDYSVFSGCTGLTSVMIPDSVTSIGSYAFSGCTGLTSVTIPDSVTSIGNSAFNGCTGLTSVTIPGRVTSMGSSVFSGCTGLNEIHWYAESLNYCGENIFQNAGTAQRGIYFYIENNGYISNKLFYNCTNISKIIISENNENYFVENGIFFNKDKTSIVLCPSYLEKTNYIIPDSVTNISEYAFCNCSSLKNILIPDSVTSIGSSAFSGCSGLTSMTIPDGVTSINGSVFSGCTGLKSITLPDDITYIDTYAFSGCAGLTSVTIPESVTNIGSYAFSGCTGLSRINWNAACVENFRHFSNVFSRVGIAGNGTDVVFGDNVRNIPDFAFYVSYSDHSPNIKSVTIGRKVTSVGNSAFCGCTELERIEWNAENVSDYGSNVFFDSGTATDGIDVVFGDSVKNIPSDVFKIDSNNGLVVKTVSIGNNVESIGDYAFSGCDGLTSVIIPDSVTEIGDYAFSYCYNLTDAVIGNGITELPKYLFASCAKLKALTLGNGITSIDNEFFRDLSSLETINFPENLSSINGANGNYLLDTKWYAGQPYGPVYAGKFLFAYKGTVPAGTKIEILPGTLTLNNNLFDGCKGLTTVVIPDSVTTIGDYAFRGCTGLTSVIIPDSVTSLGREAFSGCSGLAAVTVGNGVETVGYKMFNASPLTTIKLGKNIKSIEQNAFTGITSFPEVYYAGSEDDWKTITIDPTNDMIQRGTLYFNTDITHKHSYTETIVTAATCTATGEKLLRCECGKTYTEEIPATGHQASEWITDVAESCTAGGSRHTECTVCKAVLEIETTEALGHDFKTETTAATCTSIGYETNTCQNCGECQFVKLIPMSGHTSSDWIVDSEATCMGAGSRHKECTVCKTVLETEKTSATGHDYETEITDATCTSIGYETKTCQNCGECQFVRVIPSAGHTPSDWIVDSEATCTGAGSRHKECTVCKTVLETEKTSATGHDYETEITDATCTSIGYETKTCKSCGECQFVRIISAKGHDTQAVVIPATDSESGLLISSCKACGTITESKLIRRIASVTLSATKYTYNGKNQSPTVIVKDSAGKTLRKNVDYTVSAPSVRKNPGKYAVKVTFKGNYSGTKTLYFTIAPATPTLTVTAGAKKATLKWNAQTGATGYVVYASTSKTGKYTKIATVKGGTSVSYTKTGLTTGKTYYFRVAAYTTSGGSTIYGSYSSVKSVKVK